MTMSNDKIIDLMFKGFYDNTWEGLGAYVFATYPDNYEPEPKHGFGVKCLGQYLCVFIPRAVVTDVLGLICDN